MGQRVAPAGGYKEQRRAPVLLQIGGMGGQAGNENKRGTVNVCGDVNRRSEWVAGIAVDGSQCPRPARPQQGLGDGDSVEISRWRVFRQAAGHETGQSSAIIRLGHR